MSKRNYLTLNTIIKGKLTITQPEGLKYQREQGKQVMNKEDLMKIVTTLLRLDEYWYIFRKIKVH